MRKALLLISGLASLLACGRVLPSSSAPAASSAANTRPGFHVIAEGWHGGPELGSQLSLCPVNGAVFACGSNKAVVLRGDRFVHEPALEAGLPSGRRITRIVGRWPDSAWLLHAHPDSGNWSYAVYHWTMSHWERALEVPQGHVGLSVQLVPWKTGALAYVTEPAPDLAKRPGMRFVPLGATGALPEIPSPLQGSASCSTPLQHVELQGAPSGDLIGLTTDCDGKHSFVVRWSAGSGRPVITELPPCPDGSHPLASHLALDSGVAAFGSCGLDSPYLARMDAASVSVIDTSGLAGELTAYARRGGVDHVVAGKRLLERVAGRWQDVPLPPSSHAPESCEDASTPRMILPRGVWCVGSETWVSGQTARPDCRAGTAGVLLRSSATSAVLQLP